MSALRFIKEEIVTTAVSKVTLNDVFTDDFDFYKITLADCSTSGTTQTSIEFTLNNASGSELATTSDYDLGYLRLNAHSGFTEHKSNATNNLFIGITDQAPEITGAELWVINPTDSSTYTFFTHHSSGRWGGGTNNYRGFGVATNTVKCTGFNIKEVNTRPFTTVIRVYGMAKG